MRHVKFLVVVVGAKGVRPDPENIKALIEFETPFYVIGSMRAAASGESPRVFPFQPAGYNGACPGTFREIQCMVLGHGIRYKDLWKNKDCNLVSF